MAASSLPNLPFGVSALWVQATIEACAGESPVLATRIVPASALEAVFDASHHLHLILCTLLGSQSVRALFDEIVSCHVRTSHALVGPCSLKCWLTS